MNYARFGKPVVVACVAKALRRSLLVLGSCLVMSVSPSFADESDSTPPQPKPAKVKVSGFGFFGNREMLRLLKSFQPDGEFPDAVSRNFIEDAALVLFSRASSEGYLNAAMVTSYRLSDGTMQTDTWTNVLQVRLPRDLTTREVSFKMRMGVRFHYRDIQIQGLTALTEAEARKYFVGGDTLLSLRRNRVYNRDLLDSSMSALRESLVRKGYRTAQVQTNSLTVDDASGAVDAVILVSEGLPTIVRTVKVEVNEVDDDAKTKLRTLYPDAPYSRLWEQRVARQLREEQYPHGFPDASVELSTVGSETNDNIVQLDMKAEVTTGPRVRLGEVKYTGNQRTRTSVLESRVNLEPGDWLNRLEAERSRQRLARLGVFESVGLNFEESDEDVRDVHYDFIENKPISLSLLAGYGSYELLRGGFEFEHRNIAGRAHDLSVRALQSFKSTSASVQYTIPEVFGENLDVFVKGSGLRREELTFTREEYGGSTGLRKYLEAIKTDFSLHYDYEFLNASDLDATTNAPGVTDARSAALVLDLNRDRRHTPLLPSHGLKLFGHFEAASAALGGNVDYQRIIVGGSYHLDLSGGRLLHIGVTHGVTFTAGGSTDDLPFTKRFFPGGENSVRGYQDGEASPLDADGNQLGAETYTQANLELEQLLTSTWSLVAFFDSVGFAQDRGDYPWNEGLYSVGGGIRWRSIIGPVRLEYGHNLNRRVHDPAGTLHFSIGFPF